MRAARLRGDDHAGQVRAHRVEWQPAQAVVRAERDDDDGRFDARELGFDPAGAACGRLAADRGVRDLYAAWRELFGQQRHPALLGAQAVGGGKRVPDDQHG